MNIPKELEPYFLKSWGINDDKYVRSLLATTPVEERLSQQLHYLDCTRIGKISGTRLIQTIDHTYAMEISVALKLCATIDDKSLQKEWLNRIVERHKINLDYEKENPPIWYDKKRWSNKKQSSGKVLKPRIKKDKKEKIPKDEYKDKIEGSVSKYATIPLNINPKLKIKI